MSESECVCEHPQRMSYGLEGGGFLLGRAVIFLGSRTIWKGIREDKVQGYNVVRTCPAIEDTSQKANACRSKKREKRPRLQPHTHTTHTNLSYPSTSARGLLAGVAWRSYTLSQQNTSPVRRLYPWRGWRCSSSSSSMAA